MKSFIKTFMLLLVVVALVSYSLEYIYRIIRIKGAPRSKVDLIINTDYEIEYDYIVVGNSRANFHVNPQQIEDKIALNGYNFGISGSSLFEDRLMIETIVRKGMTDKILWQIDSNHNSNDQDEAIAALWLPYIEEDYIFKNFENLEIWESQLFRSLPYYKYLRYDSRIGFREQMLSLAGKATSSTENKGYSKTTGSIQDSLKTIKYLLKDEKNLHIDYIIKMCKTNNVELILFTAPIYNSKSDFRTLSDLYKSYYDYSDQLQKSKYYKDHTHLNPLGAELFTNIIINDILK